jgi:hypothetical protein
MTPRDWLDRLCDATAAPPAIDGVSELLAAWAPIASARRALFDAADRPASLPRELAPLVAELKAREDAWVAAFAAARDRVVASRVGIAKARRYQHATGAAELYRR